MILSPRIWISDQGLRQRSPHHHCTARSNAKPGPEAGSDRALFAFPIAPRAEDSGQASLSGLESLATSLRVWYGPWASVARPHMYKTPLPAMIYFFLQNTIAHPPHSLYTQQPRQRITSSTIKMLSKIFFLAAAGFVAAQDVTEIVASATSAGASAVGSAITGDSAVSSAASSWALENPSQASSILASYASESPAAASSVLQSFLSTADPSVSSQVASAASDYFPGGSGVMPMPTNGTNSGVAAASNAGASASRSAVSSFLSEASASASGSAVSFHQ